MKKHIYLLSAALLLAISTSFAGNVSAGPTPDATAKTQDYCGVTYDQIYSYMIDQGLIATSMSQVDGSCNVLVKTTIGKCFIVYIADSSVVGMVETGF